MDIGSKVCIFVNKALVRRKLHMQSEQSGAQFWRNKKKSHVKHLIYLLQTSNILSKEYFLFSLNSISLAGLEKSFNLFSR